MYTSIPQHINFSTKYRPANFQELYAQEMVVKILSYSIINNCLNQAYLLTGIRGVGKTTSARIIAKTINCENPIVKEQKIFSCENCPNCKSLRENNHPDVLEIDAASKTSVDDIRVIIKSSEYRPLLGKYKVFIIDEVHMLSTSAFNALLKILEEPPAHVIFIFATTEVQKIPLTVVSRCQRFDLRRFTIVEIFNLLKQVINKENINIEDQALQIIAYQSEGSARDALTLLYQVGILEQASKHIITVSDVEQLFGITSLTTIIKLINFIINKDANNSIKLINDIYAAGGNLELFLIACCSLIAYLSKVKLLNNYHEDFYQLYNLEINEMIIGCSCEKLSILWQIFSQGLEEIKNCYNQLILIEMLILKAIYIQNIDFNDEDQTELNNYPKPNIKENVNPSISDKQLVINNENMSTANPTNVSIHNSDNLSVEFLKYLNTIKEIELYYFLLNNAEIVKFQYPILQLAVNNNQYKKYKEDLEKILLIWSNKNWEVSMKIEPTIISLRDSIINVIKEGKEWQKIKQHFPSADISDILCLS